MKLETILEWLNSMAPFESAESFDNVGLLIGNPDSEIRKVLVGMDLTNDMLDKAIDEKFDLIITHHPFLFHPVKQIRTDTLQGSMICKILTANISVIAMHTNLDKTDGGISDSLASLFSLEQVEKPDSFLRIGILPQALTAEEFSMLCKQNLGNEIRMHSCSKNYIRKIAVAGGAYGEGYSEACDFGADSFIVGEIKHHEIIDAIQRNMTIVEAGHYISEWPGLESFYRYFSKCAVENDWPLQISLYKSLIFA